MQIIRTFFHFFCIFLHEHLHMSLFFRTFVPDLLNIFLRKASGPFPIRFRCIPDPFSGQLRVNIKLNLNKRISIFNFFPIWLIVIFSPALPLSPAS